MSLDIDLIVVSPACEHCGREEERHVVFETNITHNLNEMAEEAGIYKHLWRPEKIGVTMAKDIISPVKSALSDMRGRPKHYKKFDSPNGCGTYEDFIPWIDEYLQACIANPEATIEVLR